MASRKKPPSPPESSYTLRPEQATMLGLPTKAPEAVPEEAVFARLAPEALRLQRVVDKYRRPAAPPEQMGFGLSFGAVSEANQLDLFGRPVAKTPAAADAPLPSSRRRARKER